MSCEEARGARLDRASGPLEPDRERALEAHLATCPECRGFAGEIDDLEGLLVSTLQGIETDATARLRLPARRRVPFAKLAIAAAIVAFGVVLTAKLLRRHVEPDAADGVLAAGKTLVLEGGALVAPGPLARARAVEPRVVLLERGAVHCVVPPGHGPFEVRSALGSVLVVGTDFTVELLSRKDPVNVNRPTLAASALIVGVVSGVVLVRLTDGLPTPVSAGQVAVATAREGIEVESLASVKENAQAARETPVLKDALARSEARVKDLEKRLAAVAPLDSAVLDASPTAPANGSGGAAGTDPKAAAAEKIVKDTIKSFDWHTGTRAFAAYCRAQSKGSNEPIDPSVYLEMSKMNVAIAEISRARGYASPYQAYSDPEVRAVFAPAWLDALGANLDPSQTAAIQQRIQDERRDPQDPNAPDKGYLEDLRASIQGKLSFEGYLSTLLRPDQQASYLASVGNDPYFGMPSNQQVLAGDPESLATSVTASWTKTFELSDTVAAAVHDVAVRLVEASAQVPTVDPSQDAATQRTASMSRAIRLLEIQEQAEKDLAAINGLSDTERARVASGSHRLLDVRPSR